MCVELLIGLHKSLLIAIYRPPSSPFNDFINEFSENFSALVPEYPSIFVIEFNLHFIKSATSQVRICADLLSSGCIPLIGFPTHKAGNTSDQIFALNPSNVTDLTSFDITFTDYRLITFSSKTAVPNKTSEIYCRKWNNVNFISLEHDLYTSLDLSLLHPPEHLDDFCSSIMDSIESICDNYALQLQTAKVRKCQFFDDELKKIEMKET